MDELLDRLIASAGGLIEAAGTTEPLPCEWAPEIVLGHVAEVDTQVWRMRVECMVDAHRGGESPPEFESWEPDAEATALRYGALDLDEAAEMLLHARAGLVGYLRDLAEDDWQARAVHVDWGEVSLEQVLLRVLDHDIEHLACL